MTRPAQPSAALASALLVMLAAFTASGTSLPEPTVTSLTLFAGTAEGLWRSTDWGRRWERVRGRTSGARVDETGAARAIQPLGAHVWLAADGGLFSSDDFGETWKALAATSGARALLLPREPDADPTVFVGTEAGLLRSRDGGRTFATTALAASAVHRLEWPGPALLVACDRGLLVTMDEGEHFNAAAAGLPEGPVMAVAVSSYFLIDPVAFAAPQSGGVFRSADAGATWKAAGLTEERVRDLVWLGPFLYAAGETTFQRSQDAGASWTRLSASPGRPRRLLFPLAPAAGSEAFLATDRGIFHTADGGEHWQAAGLAGEDVLEIATFPAPAPAKRKPKR
jgi:photosystem II stability/assembly factor-like uncharacterized protein